MDSRTLGALGSDKSSHPLYMCGASRVSRQGSSFRGYRHLGNRVILAMRRNRQIIEAPRRAMHINEGAPLRRPTLAKSEALCLLPGVHGLVERQRSVWRERVGLAVAICVALLPFVTLFGYT